MKRILKELIHVIFLVIFGEEVYSEGLEDENIIQDENKEEKPKYTKESLEQLEKMLLIALLVFYFGLVIYFFGAANYEDLSSDSDYFSDNESKPSPDSDSDSDYPFDGPILRLFHYEGEREEYEKFFKKKRIEKMRKKGMSEEEINAIEKSDSEDEMFEDEMFWDE